MQFVSCVKAKRFGHRTNHWNQTSNPLLCSAGLVVWLTPVFDWQLLNQTKQPKLNRKTHQSLFEMNQTGSAIKNNISDHQGPRGKIHEPKIWCSNGLSVCPGKGTYCFLELVTCLHNLSSIKVGWNYWLHCTSWLPEEMNTESRQEYPHLWLSMNQP